MTPRQGSIFIVYESGDRGAVAKLVKDLRSYDAVVEWDQDFQRHRTLDENVRRILANSRLVVVVVGKSPSRYREGEIELAAQNGVDLVVVRLSGVAQELVPTRLQAFPAIDASEGNVARRIIETLGDEVGSSRHGRSYQWLLGVSQRYAKISLALVFILALPLAVTYFFGWPPVPTHPSDEVPSVGLDEMCDLIVGPDRKYRKTLKYLVRTKAESYPIVGDEAASSEGVETVDLLYVQGNTHLVKMLHLSLPDAAHQVRGFSDAANDDAPVLTWAFGSRNGTWHELAGYDGSWLLPADEQGSWDNFFLLVIYKDFRLFERPGLSDKVNDAIVVEISDYGRTGMLHLMLGGQLADTEFLRSYSISPTGDRFSEIPSSLVRLSNIDAQQPLRSMLAIADTAASECKACQPAITLVRQELHRAENNRFAGWADIEILQPAGDLLVWVAAELTKDHG